MNQVSGIHIIQGLRHFVAEDGAHKRFMEWLASRQRDVGETTAERIVKKAGVSPSAATRIMKSLDALGVARFVLGRRGSKTRLVWNYSCISVGNVALSNDGALQSMSVEDDEADDMLDVSNANGSVIDQAKALIASALGVKVDKIEIKIVT